MAQDWTKETALLKAFELAQHLCLERSTALAATSRAWAVLSVAVAVQDKRLYYRPRWRPGNRPLSRSKVFLSEVHLLQRLVCAEAEALTTADNQAAFTVIFLAAVVRRALERNSFHVALAVTRLLHDYSTREGMQLYARLVHDPQRVRSEDYWRSRKRRLMSELLERYGQRLEVTQGVRGEERFAAVDDVAPLAPLVSETLAALTPWGTPCVVPEQLDPLLDGVPRLRWSGDAAEDGREVERMHALVHPACFHRLASAATLDTPMARLAIPRLLCAKSDDGSVGPRSPAPLDAREREALSAEMESLSRRRREAPNACLSILINGIVQGRIEPGRDATCRVALGPDATRVEIVTSDLSEGPPLLLAWLPLERQAATDGFRPLRRTLTLEGGQRFTFIVTPRPASDAACAPTAEILVRYQETALARWLALGLRGLSVRLNAWAWRPAARPVLLSLAVLGVALVIFRAAPRPVWTSLPAASHSPSDLSPAQPPSSPAPPAQRVERGGQQSPDDQTRSLAPRPVGVVLSDVRVLWLNFAADAPRHDAVAQRIREQLAAAGFVLASAPEQADAAIEIKVLRTSGAADASDANVHWRLRVVNAAGAVLWPASGSPREYRGPLKLTASEMARELRAAVARARPSDVQPSDRP